MQPSGCSARRKGGDATYESLVGYRDRGLCIGRRNEGNKKKATAEVDKEE